MKAKRQTTLPIALVLLMALLTCACLVLSAGAKIETGYISVAQPVTNVVGDVAITRSVSSANELSEMMNGEDLPAAAIYDVDADLAVLDSEGNAFSTLSEVLSATEYSILPIIRPTDKAAAVAIADFFADI